MTSLTPRLLPSRVNGTTAQVSSVCDDLAGPWGARTERGIGDKVHRVQQRIGFSRGVVADVFHHTQCPGVTEVGFVERGEEVHEHNEGHDHDVDLLSVDAVIWHRGQPQRIPHTHLPHSRRLDTFLKVRGSMRIRDAVLDLVLDMVGVQTCLGLVQVVQVIDRCCGFGSHGVCGEYGGAQSGATGSLLSGASKLLYVSSGPE